MHCNNARLYYGLFLRWVGAPAISFPNGNWRRERLESPKLVLSASSHVATCFHFGVLVSKGGVDRGNQPFASFQTCDFWKRIFTSLRFHQLCQVNLVFLFPFWALAYLFHEATGVSFCQLLAMMAHFFCPPCKNHVLPK